MSGLEAILAVPIAVKILAAISAPIIAGKTIKDIAALGAQAIQVGWKLYFFWSHKDLLRRLGEMLFVLIHGKLITGNKEEYSDFFLIIKSIFTQFNKTDLKKFIVYYKGVQKLLYEISLNDKYYEKHWKQLLVNPEMMSVYIMKKLLIKRIYQLIVIQLYAQSPSYQSLKMLHNNIVYIFLADGVDVDDLVKIVTDFEKVQHNHYKKHEVQYNKDFIDEQKNLLNFCDEMKKGSQVMVKIALNSLKSIIEDAQNESDDIFDVSEEMKKASSIISDMTEESKEESKTMTTVNLSRTSRRKR